MNANLLSILRSRISHIYGTTSPQEPTLPRSSRYHTNYDAPTLPSCLTGSQGILQYNAYNILNEQNHLEIKSSQLSRRRLIQTPRLNLLHQQFDSDIIRVKIVNRFFIVCTKYKILRPTRTCSSCHDNNVVFFCFSGLGCQTHSHR